MLLRFGQLAVVIVAISNISIVNSFLFQKELGGWNVSVSSPNSHLVANGQTFSEGGIINLTWIASGMTWRSALPSFKFVKRRSSNNPGCWSHKTKTIKQNPSSTILTSAKACDNNIQLEGSIMAPKLDSLTKWRPRFLESVEVPFSFKFTLDSKTQGLIFDLMIDYPDSAPVAQHLKIDHTSHGDRQDYSYIAADVSMYWNLAPFGNERLVGGGESFTYMDLRGQAFDIWVEEQGIGRGISEITTSLNVLAWPCGGNPHTTYTSIPAFLSTRGYGIAFDNYQLMMADFTGQDEAKMTASFEASTGRLQPKVSGRLWPGESIRKLMDGLTLVTGRMKGPPEWTQNGLIIGDEGGHTIVQSHLDVLHAGKVPVAGVWVQDWTGKVTNKQGTFVWWNWKLDESVYPKEWFRNQTAAGIKVLTYVNPMLTNLNQSDAVAEVFYEAKALGYLVKDANGVDIMQVPAMGSIEFGLVDVLQPAAREWWTNIIRCNVLMACEGDGTPLVHGWMHDYGEYYPMYGVPRSSDVEGLGGDIHNQYPYFYQTTAAAASEGYKDVTYFVRSGVLRSPGLVAMFWAGDQMTSWDACDGLQSALIGIMTGGLTGISITHADIGGFTAIDRLPWLPLPGIHYKRSRELNIRFLELCVFTNAIFRSHPSLIPEISSQLYDDDMLAYTKFFSELFAAFKPYRLALFEDAAQLGLPLVRHGILVEPQDTTWFNRSASFHYNGCTAKKPDGGHGGDEIGLFQFFFGDDVLVAPNMVQGSTTVWAYLPAGTWVDFWTGSVQTGPSYQEYNAPLGKPTFFYRASSIWSTHFRNMSSTFAPQIPPAMQATYV